MNATATVTAPPARPARSGIARFGVYVSGRHPVTQHHDGFEVVDLSSHPRRVVAWRDSIAAAEAEARRLNGLPEPPEPGRFVVTRHPHATEATAYELCDDETGHPHYFGPSARAALELAEGLARGQQPTTDEGDDDTPEEAHAALDAMLAEAAGRFEDTDAALCAAIEAEAGEAGSPMPLPGLLMLEADLLEQTGTIGPNARAIIAGLIRDWAHIATATEARTIEQLLDRADVA